ncbi:phosphatidylserine decarboxylase family protein [Candidatus Phytoplasma oryzae]|uniref:Phosphatidylserine decarboxylase n=1 Tax=Candidatus Phytoplasma oryzae TaxID=203274 RepID=A0A139JQR7_9MOLU|nr:phosphatidylserine decarboxylase [Candidatus Phytoplasma oryzae]KXT29288.1 phosphatidylserine decarboxylase family protein [Candidatus Phytoplasma oryzae]RAM57676.1 phosphatidylserine decarboxylase [Candidatus Phytoplasma oryzae]
MSRKKNEKSFFISKKKEKNIFLYSNINRKLWKRILLRITITKLFSNIISFYLKSFFSKIHIKKIVYNNNINLELFKRKKFNSFNDFFIREYKKIFFSQKKSIFISPCEGLISIYPIHRDSIYTIKNTKYHISDLLNNDLLSEYYTNGNIIIFRLRPSDYHRYIFIDHGFRKEKINKIKGKLHTIKPIAFKYFNVFKENNREYSILKTENFGQIVQVEVGALLVGKIHNYPIKKFSKGQEKGFFSFGGSTIILLVKKNIVSFNEQILKNTSNNIETEIKIGQKIGTKNHIY